ncbi:MAG TPA: hypothetical protein VIL16_21780 [Trebonia sp.]
MPPREENQPAHALSAPLSVDLRIGAGPLSDRAYSTVGGLPDHAARTRRTAPSGVSGRFCSIIIGPAAWSEPG